MSAAPLPNTPPEAEAAPDQHPGPSAPRANPRRGRPKRADAPIVPWAEVDRLLVFGETVRNPKTGHEAIRFPSLAMLAARYRISRTRVWQYSDKARCFPRREEARLKTEHRYEQKVIERVAGTRALATADVVEVVDDYIVRFRKELGEGKVRADSPADLDRLVRLKELLVGGADSRQELRGGISLEAIQQRHRLLRSQVETMAPELAGTAANTSPRDEAERVTPEVSAPRVHTPAHDADERGPPAGAWEAAGARLDAGRRRTVAAVAASDAVDGVAHLDEGSRRTMDGDYHSGWAGRRTAAEAAAGDDLDGEESGNGSVH